MILNKKELIEKFKDYVKNFDCSNENIMRKYCHSIRVMEFSEKIAISENLSQEDIEVATIIGLLHDYARFEQWTKYNTYNDLESIDHGDLAVEILFNQHHIEKFYDKKENYSKIYDAIKYHNKYKILEDLNESSKVFCKIIRDADKLDIMNMLADGTLPFKEEENNNIISPDIKSEFFECSMINRKNVINKNDGIILKIAFVFDYNYKFSFIYTFENKILDKFYMKINNKELFEEYFKYVKEFLNNKI